MGHGASAAPVGQPAMDVLSLVTSGHVDQLCWADNEALLVSSGHGLVLLDTENGVQQHIWTAPDGSGHPPAHISPPVFAAAAGLIAFVQHTAAQQVVQVIHNETLQSRVAIKDATNKQQEFRQLAFSADGKLLATIGGLPDNQLDVWSTVDRECLARLPLPNEVVGLGLHVFPFNSQVSDEVCLPASLNSPAILARPPGSPNAQAPRL